MREKSYMQEWNSHMQWERTHRGDGEIVCAWRGRRLRSVPSHVRERQGLPTNQETPKDLFEISNILSCDYITIVIKALFHLIWTNFLKIFYLKFICAMRKLIIWWIFFSRVENLPFLLSNKKSKLVGESCIPTLQSKTKIISWKKLDDFIVFSVIKIYHTK